MSFPVKITITWTHIMAGFEIPTGGLCAFPIADNLVIEFWHHMAQLIENNKTDGQQLSSIINTTIRCWSDEQAALDFYSYIVTNILVPSGCPENEISYTIETV